jgi:serine O-acetyltransferase
MKYKKCLNYIRSDFYRVTARKDDSIMKMWLAARLNLGLRYMFWFRLSNCDNILLGGGSKNNSLSNVATLSYRYTENN